MACITFQSAAPHTYQPPTPYISQPPSQPSRHFQDPEVHHPSYRQLWNQDPSHNQLWNQQLWQDHVRNPLHSNSNLVHQDIYQPVHAPQQNPQISHTFQPWNQFLSTIQSWNQAPQQDQYSNQQPSCYHQPPPNPTYQNFPVLNSFTPNLKKWDEVDDWIGASLHQQEQPMEAMCNGDREFLKPLKSVLELVRSQNPQSLHPLNNQPVMQEHSYPHLYSSAMVTHPSTMTFNPHSNPSSSPYHQSQLSNSIPNHAHQEIHLPTSNHINQNLQNNPHQYQQEYDYPNQVNQVISVEKNFSCRGFSPGNQYCACLGCGGTTLEVVTSQNPVHEGGYQLENQFHGVLPQRSQAVPEQSSPKPLEKSTFQADWASAPTKTFQESAIQITQQQQKTYSLGFSSESSHGGFPTLSLNSTANMPAIPTLKSLPSSTYNSTSPTVNRYSTYVKPILSFDNIPTLEATADDAHSVTTQQAVEKLKLEANVNSSSIDINNPRDEPREVVVDNTELFKDKHSDVSKPKDEVIDDTELLNGSLIRGEARVEEEMVKTGKDLKAAIMNGQNRAPTHIIPTRLDNLQSTYPRSTSLWVRKLKGDYKEKYKERRNSGIDTTWYENLGLMDSPTQDNRRTPSISGITTFGVEGTHFPDLLKDYKEKFKDKYSTVIKIAGESASRSELLLLSLIPSHFQLRKSHILDHFPALTSLVALLGEIFETCIQNHCIHFQIPCGQGIFKGGALSRYNSGDRGNEEEATGRGGKEVSGRGHRMIRFLLIPWAVGRHESIDEASKLHHLPPPITSKKLVTVFNFIRTVSAFVICRVLQFCKAVDEVGLSFYHILTFAAGSAMDFPQDKRVRFQDWKSDQHTKGLHSASNGTHVRNLRTTISSFSGRFQRGFESNSESIKRIGRSLQSYSFNGALSKGWNSTNKILDPQGPFLQRWNKIFVLSCVIAVSLDPLFFYIPVIDGEKKCLDLDRKMEITASVLRSSTDIFYILHIIFQFRTGFIAPSSRVFGRGVLVENTRAIAMRYLSSYFLIDILAVLPLPQVVIGIIIPRMSGSKSLNTKNLLKFVVFFQYVPRCIRIYPLYMEVTRTSGILTETAWAGAAFNLFLYMLASHVLGAFWYLFSIERATVCWKEACSKTSGCSIKSLYCDGGSQVGSKTFLDGFCSIQQPNEKTFNFGIFLDSLQSGVVMSSMGFLQKLFYCFWWGLRNLSALGQNLETSTYVWEIFFAIFVSISGLVLFSFLIGNMQTYLQSTTTRLEEMRVRRRDSEQWMSHRLLPQNLRERIRRHEQYKWQETRGVDEDNLVYNLPKDLRRDIKRHLCLALLMRVPIFENMDDQLLDAMCDRLKPVLYTEESYIAREGDPVDQMLFIMRGKLLTITTNGGRSGFFNSEYLRAGDFCGEELLTWALDPQSSSNLPISTRTVRTITEVEAFALTADDLKFVATQFRRLHSKQLRHTFRFYSHQWRGWATCFIQAAWRRYIKKKLEESLRQEENRLQDALAKADGTSPSLGATIYASRFAANALRAIRRSGTRKARLPERIPPLLLQKPAEPDFTAEE